MKMSDTSSMSSEGGMETSPLVAAFLSLLIPGLGLIIPGEPLKGRGIYWLGGSLIAALLLFGFSIITLGLGLILWLAWPLIHIAAAVDTFVQVDRAY